MANPRTYFTYILANANRHLYIGMTNDIARRLQEHRTSKKGFAASYKMTRLVYYEVFEGPNAAMERERILKKWRREKKIQLIESKNPMWEELVVEGNVGISHPTDSK
ncbi:MAG: GIY-YIG nuclease family protein [FCB group bacterium]|nr:GIY-YIG nuclease family protein [FCB group bacterium]MBL7123209.1 GIY-YIG nuclease family protein [Candidatus Neomarinimicrobiota bacterium]